MRVNDDVVNGALRKLKDKSTADGSVWCIEQWRAAAQLLEVRFARPLHTYAP